MYLDAFTLSALVDEFHDSLVGGRVQDVLEVEQDAFGLEIYSARRRHYLLLSADQQRPRIQLFADRLRRGTVRPGQLALLLRRYLESASLVHVNQPPWERIIQFDFEGADGPISVIAEPMERRANVLLVRDGIILDCARRVGPDENRHRLSLPNHDYHLPPPQLGRLDVAHLTSESLSGILRHSDDTKRRTHQALSSGLLGFSPLLSREAVFRTCGDANQRASDADPDALLNSIREIVEPLGHRMWQPGVVMDGEVAQAFSVYPIAHLPGWRPLPSISQAINACFGAPVGDQAYDAARAHVRHELHDALKRLGAKAASLEKSLTDPAERERLRQDGELILAYQYAIQPGQRELRAQYDPDEPERIIPLDPTLTPLQNAQACFARYDKARRALEDVPALLDETRQEIAFLHNLDSDLDLASSWPDIDEVQQVLQSRGHWRGKPARKMAGSGQSAPLRVVTPEGFVIWVGRNSRQNDLVTFTKGGGADYWLHARGIPGAHVVIKTEGRTVPQGVIAAAAALAAYYSAGRQEGHVSVDVTRCARVRRIKGAAPGMVTYRGEETLSVAPLHESALLP